MAYDLQIGSDNKGLRAEVVDSLVKQIAEPSYKLKPILTVLPTSAWKNTFFREDPTETSGPSGNVFKGVPWGATFPQSDTTWQEVSVRIIKHAVETNIPYEQIISSEIDVQARTIIRRTREIVKSVDDDIWSVMSQLGVLGAWSIQSMAIANGRYWSVTSAAIIDDVFYAKMLISKKNYDVSDLVCFVNPDDARNIMLYLTNKGAQFPQIAESVVRNGSIGKIGNVTFVEAQSVANSYALVVVPKTCATFKQLVPLQSATTEDPLKSWRIRVVEEGVVELTDPLAVCLIKGTAAP